MAQEAGGNGCDCVTCQASNNTTKSAPSIRIVVMYDEIRSKWLQSHADKFYERFNQNVTIVPYGGGPLVNEYLSYLLDENNFSKYDGLIASPNFIGTLSTSGILSDMTDFVERDTEGQWSDILTYYRMWNGIFNGRVRMMIMDDNASLLYFHKELFREHNRTVPRTWEEYNREAKYFNQLEGVSGSCLKRVKGCGLQHQLNMIYSPKTQTMGTSRGSMFDPEKMSTINMCGASFVESLRIFEEQIKYERTNDNNVDSTSQSIATKCLSPDLVEQRCALSYGPVASVLQDYPADQYQDFIGIARMPGSTTVLDSDTNSMVQCTPKICPFAEFEDGLGWVNYAPFLGSASLGAGVSNHTDPIKQDIASKFFGYVSINSLDDAIPLANASASMINPFRRSHFSLEEYKSRGYKLEFAKQHVAAFASMDSPNADPLPRAPGINQLLELMEGALAIYLNQTVFAGVNTTDQDRTDFALEVKGIVDARLEEIGRQEFFESYQRSLGIYVEPGSPQYVNVAFYVYGYALCSILIVSVVFCVYWSVVRRNDKAMALSQPRILRMACFGMLLIGASIIPLSVNDEMASVAYCDAACKAVPWTYVTGLSILMGAIFSKIARIEDISRGEGFGESAAYMIPKRRVLETLAVPFIPNFILLLSWSIVAPPRWVREAIESDNASEFATSEPDTMGFCKNDRNLFFVILISYNLVIQAYQMFKLYICLGRIERKLVDSQWISFALAGEIQVWLISLTILAIVRHDKPVLYFIRATTTFFSAFVPLVALFLPVTFLRENTEKMLDQYINDEANHKKYQLKLAEEREKVEELRKELKELGVDVKPSKRNIFRSALLTTAFCRWSDTRDSSSDTIVKESRVSFAADTKSSNSRSSNLGLGQSSRKGSRSSTSWRGSDSSFSHLPWYKPSS